MDVKYNILRKHTHINLEIWGPSSDILNAMEEYAILKVTEFKQSLKNQTSSRDCERCLSEPTETIPDMILEAEQMITGAFTIR